MLRPQAIHSYDYVNHPYEQVRGALSRDALAVFRAATKAASSRAHDVASALRIQVAGVEIQKDIVIAVKRTEEARSPALDTMVTQIDLEWEAAKTPRLFPLMRAQLKVYALTASETQLDLEGHYEPPLGAVGKVIDAMLGRRIAEASVHQFLTDVAEYLRRALPSKK
ncbi:MAG TPA: hypothetical protein VFZ65_06800 [Planctomycetota bacterium]|nr:hypothetical protein [Planctomycetota bacterium]